MVDKIEYKWEVEALKAAFEASYDGIHILDKDGKTILINSACERIEGITKSDIGNKTIQQLVDEGYYDESVTLMVLEQKKEVTRLQRVKNGKSILVTGVPIYDDNGDVFRVMVNSRDITELTELRKEVQEKNNLIDIYRAEWNLNRLGKEFVTNSRCMEKVLKTAINAAKVNSNILITGESGTGKSMLAEMIHNNSQRKEKPLIEIDCNAIPESLFESELFGYESGAFTGASTKGKTGLVQMADQGTLFFDEIGEIPLMMQSKLLRLIQEKTFYKVGGNAPIEVDIRIVSATNKNLGEMVKKGLFREDLFYRVNVIPIEMPSLRERKEDIPALIGNCLKRINGEHHFNRKMSNKAIDKLLEYNWPGNIRELENVIERMAVMADGDVIGMDDLPMNITAESNRIDEFDRDTSYKDLMERYERRIFEKMISESHTPIEIADILNIDVTTVRRKLHKYKISFK